jgi:hypothetical protein
MPVMNVRPSVNDRMRGSGYGVISSGCPCCGDQGEQPARQDERNPESQQPARRRQQEALDQQLADEPAPGRSQRQAHGDLSLPHEAPGDQQVGNVGACHQQHQSDHAHQDHQRRREIVVARCTEGQGRYPNGLHGYPIG